MAHRLVPVTLHDHLLGDVFVTDRLGAAIQTARVGEQDNAFLAVDGLEEFRVIVEHGVQHHRVVQLQRGMDFVQRPDQFDHAGLALDPGKIAGDTARQLVVDDGRAVERMVETFQDRNRLGVGGFGEIVIGQGQHHADALRIQCIDMRLGETVVHVAGTAAIERTAALHGIEERLDPPADRKSVV